MSVNVVWFKRDLRLSDNAAINDAVNRDLPIICLFNLDSQRIGRMDVSGIHIE
ncbi:MAG: deoxyribodipyrimidine photolyase, partial [Euryarchaeota archaeon]|nr:deoxyribodipyrimidine photolyase [Euryarchaeota archaeon]